MAASNSNAARKKAGARAKHTAPAADAAPKAEGKKKSEGASSGKVASVTEISGKDAGPGKVKLWIESVQRFLKSVRSEMDRVTWPSWKELRTSTIVVVVTLLLVSMYMGVVDYVLSLLFGTPQTGF